MSQMLENKRTSRGTRMAELVGEAADQDETFWNDGIWQEAESDAESFVAEEEKPDVFDSDFDESETEEEDDSDDEKAAKRVVPITSSNKYKEPTKAYKAPVKRKEVVDGIVVSEPRQKVVKSSHTVDDGGALRTIRKSTSAKTLSADAARNEKDEEMRAKSKPSQRRIITKFTQEELLVESFETVDFNNKWLTTQRLIMEERAVADRPVKKVNENASFVRFHSKRGGIRTITFSSSDAMPAVLTGSNEPPDVPDNTCVITGLPARYRDPSTGYPYRDLAAFREIRRRFHQQQME